MAKRQIKFEITTEGEIKVDNTGNPDEQKILAELGELAELLNGDEKGYKIEAHKHTHGSHSHVHTHSHGH